LNRFNAEGDHYVLLIVPSTIIVRNGLLHTRLEVKGRLFESLRGVVSPVGRGVHNWITKPSCVE
jgi:hypothetical protein